MAAGGRNVRAVYLFHRSGDPLATAAADNIPPIQADQLAPVLGAVRDFVDTPIPASRRIQQTSMQFGEEGLVAVRGRYVSACAVCRGRNNRPLRRNLARMVRTFEDRNAATLETWQGAMGLADVASNTISGFVDLSVAG